MKQEKMRIHDMIDQYIEKEKERAVKETERTRRFVLEDFAFFMDGIKGSPWKIHEITEADGREYYKHHKKKETSFGQAMRRIQIVNHFLDFAVKENWLEARPWHELFENERHPRHERLSEEERTRLIEYLKKLKGKEFYQLRDRAVLLLLAGYRLQYTEVSRMNKSDYDGRTLKITSAVKWRDTTITLKDYEKEALDEYLDGRKERARETEEALFIGTQNRRLAPGTMKNILKHYLEKSREE